MNQFIPYSEEKAEKLSQQLSGTLFNNVENFVNFYNSGIIAKRSDEIVELTKEVVGTYKNLEEKGGLIVFLSEAEVYLSETFELLTPWTFVVRIKRELSDIKNEGKIKDDTIIAFSKNTDFGYALKLSKKDDQNILTKIGNEKIFTKEHQLSEIFDKFSSIKQSDDENYYFRASDFLNLNDSFITQIHNEIPKF